jgi:hypothetical protein
LSIYDDFMANKSAPVPSSSAGDGSIYENFMAGQQSGQQTAQQAFAPTGNSVYDSFMPQQQPAANQEQSGIMDALGSAWNVIKEPASTALEALSYLDKPRGAIAGAVQAYQNDTPLLEGAQKGWKENTSWKETFDPQWVAENPTTAAIAGLATDIAADPLLFLTPAKVVGGLAKGSKAVGLTDKINPLIKTIEESDLGKNLIAKGEDWTGQIRPGMADAKGDFAAGRASDYVIGQDTTDQISKLAKDNPGVDMTPLTNYVEAKPKDLLMNTTIPSERAGIVAAAEDGSLLKAVENNVVTKDQAFNVLREENRVVPDYLLQEHQRLAKAEQYMPGQVIPDYKYRDEVLNAIPDTNLRNQFQKVGDMIINANQKQSSALYNSDRLTAEQFVRFQEGSHLRRSFEQYETPDKFLEAVRKNGTPEEWQRVFSDYQTAQKGGTGFGAAHKVDMKDFTGRQVLSDETLKKMGVINDPLYKVTDTFNRGSKTLHEDKFLTTVDKLYGKSEQEGAMLSRNLPKSREYVPVPDTKGYGTLAGKWVPADVAKQVLSTLGQSPDNINKTFGKILSWWKVEKLANPASIMRNLWSGIPMANVFGKVPLQQLPKYMAKVTGAFMSGGKNNPLIREIRSSGALENPWAKQELNNIIGNHPSGIKKAADMGMKAFGAPDVFSRAVVFAYHRDHGMSVREATKFANKAQFDYSSAPDWVKWLSKTGAMPFARFPFFAGKATLKASYENPAQITKYVKAQNQVNSDDRDKLLPDYLKAKTLLPLGNGTRMVNGKPQKIQNNLDLSYILPFANTLNMGNPAIDALMLARTGKNGIGQQVVKPGMTPGEKAGVWADWAYNALGPALPLPGNYAGDKLYNASKGNVDSKGRAYNMTDAIGQTVLGLKNVPINETELFRQKITSLTSEQNNIKAVMGTIAKDQSLSKEQKTEQIKGHVNQLKELGKQLKDTGAAWQREKKRGVN